MQNASYKYQFGMALHENGLNLVSAGLRLLRPELFAHSTDIKIKAPDPGPPPQLGHTLTLYAVVNKPIAFDLYPISTRPDLPIDSFFVGVDLSFSLTDDVYGTVTRIGAGIQAAGTISLVNGVATIRLLEFKIVELRGEQPELSAALIAGAVDAGASIDRAYHFSDADAELGRTFRAIMNYLIDLFLKSALEKAVVQFPVPPLNEIVKFNQLGVLPIQGLFIRNDCFYVLVGDDLLVPAQFPDGLLSPPHLRVGLSESGIHRIVKDMLPIPVPFETGHPYNTLDVTSTNLQIVDIEINLQPPNDRIACAINVAGEIDLNFHIPIPIFGGYLDFTIPLPLGPITGYHGGFWARFDVGDFVTDPNAVVKVMLKPDTKFFDDWFVVVVTAYRNMLPDLFRKEVDKFRDHLIGDKFCDIPFLGWLVCGVIDVVAEVVGYVTGFVLDLFMSTFLTLIMNSIGRVLLAKFVDKEFRIKEISQKVLHDRMGVTVKSAALAVIANGRDGDLDVRLWFEDQGLPVPPLPAPPQLPPVPPPPADPGLPSLPTLPEFPDTAFRPAYPLSTPNWTTGTRQRYTVQAGGDHGAQTLTADVTFDLAVGGGPAGTGGRWTLRAILRDTAGAAVTTATGEYEADTLAPRRGEHAATANGVTIRQIVDYTSNVSQAAVSLGVDGKASSQQDVLLRAGVPREFELLWLFRIAHCTLEPTVSGSFGRIEFRAPTSATNWARQVPTLLTVAAGSFNDAPAGKPPHLVPIWNVVGQDEQRRTEAVVAQDGSGLISAKITSGTDIVVIARQ